jgi:hypothetical protein
MPNPRTADPYRDLAVIDARAARANQLVIGLLSLAALATGASWLLALGALQLTVTLLLGRRACLACRIWFDLLQPRFGEGPLEDSRPVKFANRIGATFLWSATLAHLAGWHLAGNVLGGMVATLALLAASTGFCAGCTLYRAWAFLRGVRGATPGRVDLAELGAPPGREAVIQFTHPLCADCRALETHLTVSGRSPVLVDVSRRPDLARKYGVSGVPFAVAVRADGHVAQRLH